MILHYLKVALRTLFKYRTHSLISVICLAVGITFFTLVWYFVGMVIGWEQLPRSEERIRLIAERESYANLIDWEDVCFLQSQQIAGIDSLVATSYSNEIEVTLFDHQQNEHPYLVECQNVTPNFFVCQGLSFMEGNRTLAAPDEIVELAKQRADAKANKDWATADTLRNQIDAAGWTVLDGKDGYKIVKKA